MGDTAHGNCVYSAHRNSSAHLLGADYEVVLRGCGGNRLWSDSYAVFLPVLLDSGNSSFAGGNGARDRKEHTAHGGASCFTLPFPNRMDSAGIAVLYVY